MSLPDPGLTRNHTSASPTPPATSRSPIHKTFAQAQGQLQQLSIRQKIGFGYAVAIGLAVIGTVTGRILGDYHYEQQAREQLEQIHIEASLLRTLRFGLLEARTHEQQFASLLKSPAAFDEHYEHFLEHVVEVKQAIAELETVAAASEHPELQRFLETHREDIQQYFRRTESLLQTVERTNLSAEQVAVGQRSLLDFTDDEVASQFDEVSEDVSELLEATSHKENQAFEAVERAETLGTQVTTVAMLLSIIIAVILAIYTSRAIARPIETVTQVAQRATRESNFNLQALVTTEDEVGALATALNQLIAWVGEYTQELELARQTLEERVQKRTEELSHKNQQLQDAHDQLSQALGTLQQTQAQLIQTEKMSGLGQMVAGVAHEINNPVNFIHGNLSYASNYTQDLLGLIHLYQQQYPSPTPAIADLTESIDFEFLADDLPKILSSMQIGSDRIRQIVLSLRNFSRLDEAEMKPVDLHEGLDSTLLILNHRIKQGIEVVKQYGALPLVECYPAQLNQVFMNIVNNAIDALLAQTEQAHKQIMIQTEVVSEPDQPKWAMIRIRDNGPGMPEAVRSKLFDPFFTTKPVGQGTGLGLAICYQIVEKHQGTITVASEPGQGSEFAIALPIG